MRILADFLGRLLQYQQSEGSLHLLVERCHAASEAPAQLYLMSTKEIFCTKELMIRKCRPKIIATLISGVMNTLGFYRSHTARRQGLEFLKLQGDSRDQKQYASEPMTGSGQVE